MWSQPDYLHAFALGELAPASDFLFQRTVRADASTPGFGIAVLPSGTTSKELRQTMVQLSQLLSDHYERQFGERWNYLSLGRFDQQTTTKLHLDGGPESSFLMLGYEPTQVRSHMHIADYSLRASQLGLSPEAFLDQYNPMFKPGQETLTSVLTIVDTWPEDQARVVLVNNSRTSEGHRLHSPGVLHGASIPQPDAAHHRIINSTLLTPSSYSSTDMSEAIQEFLRTDQISGPILMAS